LTDYWCSVGVSVCGRWWIQIYRKLAVHSAAAVKGLWCEGLTVEGEGAVEFWNGKGEEGLKPCQLLFRVMKFGFTLPMLFFRSSERIFIYSVYSWFI
jgi:hypothetical protein